MTAQDYLFANPVFSNGRFTRNAGIPVATASRFTRILLKNGLLEHVRGLRSASGHLPVRTADEEGAGVE